jgi:ferredoxin/flavodoxin
MSESPGIPERVLIIYFSGTGNTWVMASAIAKEFEKLGVRADLLAIEQAPVNLDLSGYAMLGIGFPVYAWCFPSNVRRLIKKLPQGQGRRAFVFSTIQGSSLGSEALLARYLKKKGYRVQAGRAFLAVNNETIYYGPADPKNPHTIEKIERMKSKAPAFVGEIVRGKGVIERNKPFYVMLSEFAGVIFDLLDGWLASRNFRITESCDSCGLCERICPTDNIYASLTWPRFRNRCLMCERCVNFCPRGAITHPLRRVNTEVRYHAAGYTPSILRLPSL